MVVELALQLGLVVALFAVAFVVERRIAGVEPLLSVPPFVQAIVGGLALMAPFMLLWEGILTDPVPLVDDTILALALSFALWILAGRVVGIGRQSGTC